MQTPDNMTQAIDQLKDLLFDEEQQEISELRQRLSKISQEERLAREILQSRVEDIITQGAARQQRLDDIFNRVGSQDNLRKSVAEVLDGALIDVDTSDDPRKSEHLRRAMVPFVTKTVTTEISNNRAELVKVLQPSIGMMIRDYVTSQINDMMATINAKLENALPGAQAKLRRKAKALKMTTAQLVLAQSLKPQVVGIYLVQRGSGKVIAHWDSQVVEPLTSDPADDPTPRPQISNNHEMLVGAFLNVVMDVAKDAFEDTQASLRTLEMTDYHVYLRNTPAYILAVRCTGVPLPGMDLTIDAELLRLVTEHGDLLAEVSSPTGRRLADAINRGAELGTHDTGKGAIVAGAIGTVTSIEDMLPELARSLDAKLSTRHGELFAPQPNERKGRNPLKMLAWIVGLPLLAWITWISWQGYWTNWTEQNARHAIASIGEMKGYPIDITVSPGGAALQLSGLTPNKQVKETMLARIEQDLPNVAVRNELSVLPIPDAIDPTPRIAEVARQISRVEAENETAIKSLARQRRAALRAMATDTQTDLSNLKALSASQLQALEARRQSKLAALETRQREALAELVKQNERQLSDIEAKAARQRSQLAARNAQDLSRLERSIQREAIIRAVDRSDRRLAATITRLTQLQARPTGGSGLGRIPGSAEFLSGLNAAQAADLATAVEMARHARTGLGELTRVLRKSVEPVALAELQHKKQFAALNKLREQILNASAILTAMSGLHDAQQSPAADRREQAGSPSPSALGNATQAAEELALAAERLAVLSSSVARLVTLDPVRQQVGTVSSSLGTLTKRVDNLSPTAFQRLRDWLHSNAIFFSNNAEYRNPKRAGQKLDTLVQLLRDAPKLIRVVGYTDATGPLSGNATLAQQRAARVAKALRKRGLRANMITIVGRTNGPDLSADTGPTSPNRRVQFELGLNDESVANP